MLALIRAATAASLSFTHHPIPTEWSDYYNDNANVHIAYTIYDCNNPIHALAYGGTDTLNSACGDNARVITQVNKPNGKICHVACTKLKDGISQSVVPPVIDVSEPIVDASVCSVCIGGNPVNFLDPSFDISYARCRSCAMHIADYTQMEGIVDYPTDGFWKDPMPAECAQELIQMTGSSTPCVKSATEPPSTSGSHGVAECLTSLFIVFVTALLY